MNNSNLRDAIRTAFYTSGLSVQSFNTTMNDIIDELYDEEEKNATTCEHNCMSLPWDPFFDNIIFPYITAQIPECKDLANLSHDDEIYQTLRSETKGYFSSIGKFHSILTSDHHDENTLNAFLSALLR